DIEPVHRRVEPLEALPAVGALVDAVIGAGEHGARLVRMHRQTEDAALAPQPLHDAPPALAAIGAEPQAAADRAGANGVFACHAFLPRNSVVPAKAGTHGSAVMPLDGSVPAYAGTAAELSVRAFPAGMRDVDDDAIRAGPFHLEIGVYAVSHRGVAVLLRGEALRVRPLQLLGGFVEIIHLEAEMVDAVEVRSVRADIGVLVGLVLQDSDMDVAVGQEHRAVRAAPQFPEAERRFVELSDLRRLLGRQCDVFDACHDLLSKLRLRS